MASEPEQSKELSQLARFLFSRAALLFWSGWVIEGVAGALAVGFGLAELSEGLSIAAAVLLATLLAAAYILRIFSENEHDTAETMRRQSVFSEGLGWPVAGWQYSRWIQRSGTKLMERLGLRPREDDYYATSAAMGSKRLAEMTLESAFYTRHLYAKLGWRFWMVTGTSVVGLLSLLAVSATRTVPETSGLVLSHAVFLAIPVLLGLDFLGWALRLGRLQTGIEEVERDLEEVLRRPPVDDAKIIRLVAEYNCLTVTGIPIPDLLFRRWHYDIDAQWKRRLATLSSNIEL
jgi:hypothetical protein